MPVEAKFFAPNIANGYGSPKVAIFERQKLRNLMGAPEMTEIDRCVDDGRGCGVYTSVGEAEAVLLRSRSSLLIWSTDVMIEAYAGDELVGKLRSAGIDR